MYLKENITDDLCYIGCSSRRVGLFENLYPVDGMSYNSYLLSDQSTVLFDTVDQSVAQQFMENLRAALSGRSLDYIIVNHMEPDHSATLQQVCALYPQAKIVCTLKARTMLQRFFPGFDCKNVIAVKDGDTLCTGKHTLTFFLSPMVHWPEVMVTFASDGTLFSADAFGAFGPLHGSIYAADYNIADIMPEARRYYCNIVGKYGAQVSALLKKAAVLPIKRVCPLHGPIWHDITPMLEKYSLWSTYTPEDDQAVIFCGSIYGHTANAAQILASELNCRGLKAQVYDVSHVHISYLVAEAFRASTIVFASVTYNAGIYPPMEHLLLELKNHGLSGRRSAIIENGSWAPVAAERIGAVLQSMKDIKIDGAVTIPSAVNEDALTHLKDLAQTLTQKII